MRILFASNDSLTHSRRKRALAANPVPNKSLRLNSNRRAAVPVERFVDRSRFAARWILRDGREAIPCGLRLSECLGLTIHDIRGLVPGAGLDASGHLVRVKRPKFLVHIPQPQAAFRQHMHRLLEKHDWQVDPQVWSIDWGVHIRPVGSGASAIKYLGAYVACTAIGTPSHSPSLAA